ncbi:MAG: flagellar protein [Clostridiales bacterium]|nr:flagellar protein [Clostridiales bacterium]
MKINNKPFLSIEQLQDQYLKQTKPAANEAKADGLSFQDILAEKTERAGELKFSKHASNRLTDRNITLTDKQLERLSEGTQKAGAKGIRESLVLVDSLAFIVNVPNRTVVTAMNQNEADENIFTNIDGAVIM